jgi:RNase P subunit RPR2
MRLLDEKMKDAKPVRCQKCGTPLGYVTVLAEGLRFQQPLQNVKVVAICMDCFQKQ